MLEPGVGTVPEHRWGAGRAWRPTALLGLPALSLSLRSRRLGAPLGLSRDSAAVRSTVALLFPDLSHSPDRRVYLERPRVCPGHGVERGAGGRWGRGVRGADGRRRWGERARE